MQFTHLHVHTAYSTNDSIALIPDLVAKAKKLGMNSLAITDHGNIYGAKQFYMECALHNIKAIFGCEIYILCEEKQDRLYHLTLLAEDYQGFNNLANIINASQSNIVNDRPAVKKQILQKYTAGIIALSGCIGGEIPKKIIDSSYEAALVAAIKYKKLFPPNYFFLEITSHGWVHSERVNPALARISRQANIPMVATNDVHIVEKSDYLKHPAMLGKNANQESKKLYLMSKEEIMRQLVYFPYKNQAIKNAQIIADRCNVNPESIYNILSTISIPDDAAQYVDKIIQLSAREGHGTEWVWQWKELSALNKDFLHRTIVRHHSDFYYAEKFLPGKKDLQDVLQGVKQVLDNTEDFPKLPDSELKRLVEKYIKRTNTQIREQHLIANGLIPPKKSKRRQYKPYDNDDWIKLTDIDKNRIAEQIKKVYISLKPQQPITKDVIDEITLKVSNGIKPLPLTRFQLEAIVKGMLDRWENREGDIQPKPNKKWSKKPRK